MVENGSNFNKRSEYDIKDVRVAILKSMGAKRLQHVGDSLAILVPLKWAKANAVSVDGDYWMKVAYIGATIIEVSPLDEAELQGLMEVNEVLPEPMEVKSE